MALSISIVKRLGGEGSKVTYADVTFDSSYATGGEALAAADIGLKEILMVTTDGGAKNAAGTSAVPVRYDYVNKKLQAYRYDGASAGKTFLEEVTAGVDLSTFTTRAKFEGIA